MSARVEIRFLCSGCDAVAITPEQYVGRKFHGINGKDHGFGVWRWETPDLKALYPEDWQTDPLTCADYCPKCAAEIWPEQEGADDGE